MTGILPLLQDFYTLKLYNDTFLTNNTQEDKQRLFRGLFLLFIHNI